MNKTSRKKEIEMTLAAFDAEEPLKASPFFYSGVESRLKDWELGRHNVSPILLVQGIALILLVVINFLTFFRNIENNDSKTKTLTAVQREFFTYSIVDYQ